MESIGERIKRLRQCRVLSQSELSMSSGVPLPTLKDIERGATRTPHPRTVRALAAALGVEGSYLIGGQR